MARSDKKNRTCIRCERAFASPQKLRQHYKSSKNQCTLHPPSDHPPEQIPEQSQDHPPVDQIPDQPQTQLQEQPEDEQPTEEEWDYIDRLARKPKEHMRTWGSRLRQRWYEITGEKRDLPVTEKACKLYHKDLLAIDEEAYEKIRKNQSTLLPPKQSPEQPPEQPSADQPLEQTPDNQIPDQPQEQPEDVEDEEELEADPGPSTSRENRLIFKERESDPMRQHSMLNQLSVWTAEIPSSNAFAFNTELDPMINYTDVPYMPQLMAISRPQITEVLEREMDRKDQIKSAITIKALYKKYVYKGKGDPTDKKNYDVIYRHDYHRGEMRVLLSKNAIPEHITKTVGEIDPQIEYFVNGESSMFLIRLEEIKIEAYTYRRAEGGSYILTPRALANKKCTINPDNKGLIDPETGKLSEKCLQGALGAYFAHQDGHTEKLERIFRAEKFKPYLERVNLEGIPMPTPVDSHVFKKIERLNPDIAINVWEWVGKEGKPKTVIASKNYNRPHIIHLMALTDIIKSDKDKYGQKNHFLWIKNPDALVFKDTAHHGKRYLCDKCTISFPSEKSRNHHRDWCFGSDEAPQRVELPEQGKNNFEQFKNINRMMYAPCVIIADFEADNKKRNENYGGNMRKIMEQKANSFCYMVHWIEDNKTWGPFLYRGPNATEEFVRRLDGELRRINEVLDVKKDCVITEEAKRQFARADQCWVCKGKFTETDNEDTILDLENKCLDIKLSLNIKTMGPDEYKSATAELTKTQKELAKEKARCEKHKVWDHCHMTGKFRGAAHSACNLKLQIEAWKTPIPVVFHNFRGYDSHLVCESVGRSVNAQQIKVIAETFERYKSMKVGQFKYIDSMQFMNSSLANLVKNLGANKPITKQHFANFSSSQIDLITRKGVYPYEYIDSHDRFKETKLPPIHEFYGHLNGKIKQADYEHAQRVWKEFDCKNLGEYHDLYLKTDVLLLADIWTAFRKTSMQHYGLDPSHYVSAPALSWDAMLKYTGVEIELFTDMDMHDFIEKAKRGGIAMACQRFLKANNPKIGASFDPSKPSTWISYVDANNLYGWAMSQFLPIGRYKWEASREYLEQNPDRQKHYLDVALNTKPDASRGFFLNIKAHFPLKTHDYLQDLPPAVDSIAVKKDKLSPYIAGLVEDLDGGKFPVTEKLVPHLGKREDYVIHYQELQYYVKLGMVVDEVTQILSFDQTNWLAPYIAMNTKLRQQAKNTFEKDFFKLMNNSVYGKTMENVRKYQDVKIMRMTNENDEKKFRNKVRSPSFKYARPFNDTLVGAHMGKASVTLNKPIIVGASVLGLSKLLMYQFWYGFVKEKYGAKAQLGYMDTDSFIYHVKTEDIYKDMAERPDLFDLNDTKTIGLFKDETPGNVITESYHIRAKSYHYVLADNTTKSKHKGVSKKGMSDMAESTYPDIEGDPMTQVYRDCLFGNKVFYAKNVGMRSKDHVISLVESEKKALSPIDTKRWIWSDGISSLPFGHWRITAYKRLLERGRTPVDAEKISRWTRLPEKYQNENTNHISSVSQ